MTPTIKKSNSNRSTKATLLQRQAVLQRLHNDHPSTSADGTTDSIIQQMREAGFKDYNRQMHYRDKTDLNKNSTFLIDLAQFNYSAYIEEISDNLRFIEEQAKAMYRQEWNQDKTITKHIVVNNELVQVEEHHKTAPIAAPKLKALEIIANVQKLRTDLVSGDTLNISAALIGKKFREMQEDVNRLEKPVPKSKSKTGVIKKLTSAIEENEKEDNGEKQQ